MVKRPKLPVETLKSNYVEDYHRLDGEVEQFSARINKRSPCHMTQEDARRERERITAGLLAIAESTEDDVEPDEDRFQ